MATFTTATRTNKTVKTRRGFNFPACDSIYRYQVPYNTGNDFVYNDNFTDPIAHYKEITSQATKSNPESMGRFHTDWLNMMYPRLRLAANLLRDDGVIFISIDDNEVHNLRKLCDEVFGEENFVADFIWEKRFTRNNDAKLMSSVIDHVLCYRKSDAVAILREPRTEKANSIYSNPDNDPRGAWTSVSYVSQRTKEQRPNLSYDMINPITQKTVSHAVNAWKYSREQYEIHAKENRLYWGKSGENTYPRLKRFLSELKDGMVPINLWAYKEVGTLDDGTKAVDGLLGKDIFDYPKPITLIQKMLHLSTEIDGNDIILDFFSGSATTAHAVMQLNAEDGGNRRFIMVQLPEITNEKSEAHKAGYKNICEIGKERIRRARAKITAEWQEKHTQATIGENLEQSSPD
ncbi:MAG: site-specific DNA-methyltransferase, partial [Defluviitaleaceae bacterium]|nr:site-specific DNA-methyltransferase [Defluviitaleaceae bacterium]